MRDARPIELGQKLASLPDGVSGYLYASAVANIPLLKRHFSDLSFVAVSPKSRGENYVFQVKKYSVEDICIVGFVNDEGLRLVNKGHDIPPSGLSIFAVPFDEYKNKVEVPLNDKLSATAREIEDENGQQISVLDLHRHSPPTPALQKPQGQWSNRAAIFNIGAVGNLHTGQGNIHQKETINQKLSVNDGSNDIAPLMKWLVAAATVVGVGWPIYQHYAGAVSLPQNHTTIATSTPDLADIFSTTNSFGTSLQRENFINTYKDSTVYGAGAFRDISKSFDGYLVIMVIENNLVGCHFDGQYEKSLLLLRNGRTVEFRGTFTGGGVMWGGGEPTPWYIKDCILI